MTAQQLAHEFFLGIRTAMSCPDVSVAEYEGVMAYMLEQFAKDAAKEERGACADVADDYEPERSGDEVVDSVFDAREKIAAAIRARS